MSSIFNKFEQWKKQFKLYLDPEYQVNDIENPTQNGRIRIPKNHYICAEVCNELYKDPNLRTKNIDTYTIDKRYNNNRTVVYKNNLLYDDSFIIGIRGTSPTSLLDIASDALIAIGKETLSIRKYKETQYIQGIIKELFKEGYNANESFITGHSLGGILCAYMLQVIPELTGVGFNTGTSPLHIPKINKFANARITPVLDGVANTNRFINYHVKGDLLSVSSTYLFQDTVILTTSPKPSKAQAHRITYILQETQPNPPFVR